MLASVEELFAQRKLDIVFVQEGRLQGDASHLSHHYRMFRSSASPMGTSGSQIWLSHKMAGFVFASRAISPRILALWLRVSDLEVLLVSAHAPTEAAAEQDKSEFWSRVEGLLTSFQDPAKFRLTFVGIDSNGKVGSTPSPSVGSAEPDVENANGFALRSIADASGVCLLNTYTDAGPTWTGSRGHRSRIDFLATSVWARHAAKHV